MIASVILNASDAEKQRLTLPLIVMTLFVVVVMFVILASGKPLQRLLGKVGLSITQRVMGLFVAAIGVQFITTGLLDVVTRFAPALRS